MSVSSIPAFAAAPGLCTQQEDSFFSCPLGNGKIVSVCAPYNPSAKAAYSSVIYRYGTPEKIELSLTANRADFGSLVSVNESTSEKPIEDDLYLRFSSHQFSYVTYAAVGTGFSLQGVAAFEGGKLLSNTSCRPDTITLDNSPKPLVALGAREEENSEAWPFWRQILPAKSAVRARKPRRSGR